MVLPKARLSASCFPLFKDVRLDTRKMRVFKAAISLWVVAKVGLTRNLIVKIAMMDGWWQSIDGNDRDASVSGSVSHAFDIDGRPYIYGGTSSGMIFPINGLGTSYTFFSRARYNGASKGRIFTSLSSCNWLSGFHDGKAGVAFHGSSPWMLKCWNPGFCILTPLYYSAPLYYLIV